ncbi:MAG TPA: carbohydrate kinase family protein [Verrucomicrobiae bacterium]|nr:carbohydrate kinase family protein [Verrucomicrobiae bacterium]
MNSTGRRIACIGGVNVDHKARLKERARHGTSNPVSVTTCTGGVAGNVARNLARLGCDVSLFSIVGADEAGAAIRREMEGMGIAASFSSPSGIHPTATYTAAIEPNGQLFIGLANMEIVEELTPEWADKISPQLAACTLWFVDANLPAATIGRLLKEHKKEATVLADPISIAKAAKFEGLLGYLDVVFPNKKEAGVLSGRKAETREEIEAAAREIVRRGARTIVVTLGEEGVYVDDGKRARFAEAIPPERVRDVTGAGDALVAGYAYAMASKQEEDPVLAALAAASLALETEESVSREMSAEGLRRRIENHKKRMARS